MEIIDFLHLTVRRVVGLVIVGLLVAVPTTALLLRDPVEYQGTVTVRLSALLPNGGAFYLWDRLSQDFETALRLPQVADTVAKQTGAAAGGISTGLTTVLPSSGDVVTVSFTASNRTRSLDVARIASTEALKVLTSQGLAEAKGRSDAANATFDAAIRDFQAFVATNDPDPQATAQATLTVLLRLDRQLAVNGLSSSPQADALEAQLDQLVATAPAYRQVLEKVETARAAAKQATVNQIAAESHDTAAGSGALVTPTGSDPKPRTAAMLATGLGVGALAVMAVIGALAALELRRGRRIDQLAVVLKPQGSPTDEPAAEWRRYRHVTLSDLSENVTRLPARTFNIGWWLLAPVGVVASVGEAALFSSGKTQAAIVVALPLGLAATVLAVTRFDIFLMGLIVVRATLDAFTSETNATGKIDPGVAIGAVFIVCATLWLLAQRRSGYWIKISSATWALWAFIAACVISIPTSFALSGSIIATSKALAGVLMFAVLEQYLGRRPEHARRLLVCLFASFAIPGLVAVKQWLSGEGNTYYVDVSRVSGTFVHSSSLANYLLMLLPLSILLVFWCRGRMRWLMIGVTFAATGLLIVTYTRAAWFAALISVAYLAIRGRRELLYVMIGAIVVLLLAVPSVAGRFADLNAAAPAPGADSNSLTWRIDYWRRLVPQAKVNPVTGLGFDAVEHIEKEGLQPHNVFVEAYVETGLAGLGALLAVVWTFARMSRRRLKRASGGWDRLLALGAMSAAIAMLVQMPSENLLTQTFVYWYLAAAMTYGVRIEDGDATAPTTDDADDIAPRALTTAEDDLVGATR